MFDSDKLKILGRMRDDVDVLPDPRSPEKAASDMMDADKYFQSGMSRWSPKPAGIDEHSIIMRRIHDYIAKKEYKRGDVVEDEVTHRFGIVLEKLGVGDPIVDENDPTRVNIAVRYRVLAGTSKDEWHQTFYLAF